MEVLDVENERGVAKLVRFCPQQYIVHSLANDAVTYDEIWSARTEYPKVFRYKDNFENKYFFISNTAVSRSGRLTLI
jgi:hypothetical protein